MGGDEPGRTGSHARPHGGTAKKNRRQVTDASDANAAGWYADPAGVHHQRYWSGDTWTARVADAFGVTAAHHVDADFSPPGGGPPRAAPLPAKVPVPSLSLVASPEVIDVVEVIDMVEVIDIVERSDASETDVVVDWPRPAGWYADPTGIHCERSWDGNEWSAVVVDRNFAMLAHAINDRFPPPHHEAQFRTG
jgi:hypothetical protein